MFISWRSLVERVFSESFGYLSVFTWLSSLFLVAVPWRNAVAQVIDVEHRQRQEPAAVGEDQPGSGQPTEPEPAPDTPSQPAANPSEVKQQPAVPAPSGAVEVQVRSTSKDAGQKLAASSAAVSVVDTKSVQSEAADLGTLLARQQGVTVQRAGGLGAQTRISLQGLGEDQVRFYVDGVPLSFTGLPESIAYVPVDLVSRIELYRGVVPIRFGGDTLGGAMHLVSHEPQVGTHGSASLSLGAFDTQRAVVRAQHLDQPTGVFATATGFLDHARNDYAMDDIEVTQPNGRKVPKRVYRQNDAYRAGFAQLELGVLDRPYAKRLSVRGFASAYDKQINHDVLMYNPYGDVLSRRRSQGATAFYEHAVKRWFTVDARAGYARRTRQLRDLSDCAYDWDDNCIAPLPNGGEISGLRTNRKTDEHDVFARVQVGVRISPLLQFRASVSPTYARSQSRDAAALETVPDTFAQARNLFGLTLGLEHELDVFEQRVENVLFIKDYVQRLSAEVTATQGTLDISQSNHEVGGGDALRVRILDSLIGKASYELGARLPSSNEVFGDGGLVDPNLELVPETSHNFNLELRWAYQSARLGEASLSTSAFLRFVDDLIFLLPGPTLAQYQNLSSAHIMGVESNARYVLPGEYLAVEGSATCQDMRNHASSGPFATFKGERVPNRPYLFANVALTGTIKRIATANDVLSLTFRESYVGEFLRAFEVPNVENQDRIPAQLVSSAVATYEVRSDDRSISASIEANNLTNESVYDFFGVKRPGRFALAKLTYRM